jgi:hypothetical protein
MTDITSAGKTSLTVASRKSSFRAAPAIISNNKSTKTGWSYYFDTDHNSAKAIIAILG